MALRKEWQTVLIFMFLNPRELIETSEPELVLSSLHGQPHSATPPTPPNVNRAQASIISEKEDLSPFHIWAL